VSRRAVALAVIRAPSRPTAIVVLALVSILSATIATSGCGASGTTANDTTVSPTVTVAATNATAASPSPTRSPSTYTDKKYGYTITVARPFVRADPGAVRLPDSAGAKHVVAWTCGYTLRGDNVMTNSLAIAVEPGDGPLTDSQAQARVDRMLADGDSLAAGLPGSSKLISSTATTVDGRPAAQFDLTSEGAESRRLRIVVVAGRAEAYLFEASSLPCYWEDLEPTIAAAIASFRFPE
jgi:hypothetical protein